MYWMLYDETSSFNRFFFFILLFLLLLLFLTFIIVIIILLSTISAMIAEEAIGWLRIVRPGSVIGPQQQFMKDMQARLWRDGDIMRQRMGINLPTECDDRSSPVLPSAAESKRDVDTTSRLMSNLSLSSSDKKSSSTSSMIGGISSAKPNLTSRLSTSGRSSLGSTSTASPEDDGEITQGDMLRQRRTHGHHLTPSEAKLQSNTNNSNSTSSSLTTTAQSKGVSSTSSSSTSKSLSSTLPSSLPSSNSSSTSTTTSSSTRPTTRSQISKLLGK